MAEESKGGIWQDPTFIMSLLTLVAGVVLVVLGHDDIGILLLGGGAVGAAVRTASKKAPPGASSGASSGAAVILVLALGLMSCTPAQGFVEAETAVYGAIAPEYLDYVRNDPRLLSDEAARRVDLVQAWKLSLTRAGGRP